MSCRLTKLLVYEMFLVEGRSLVRVFLQKPQGLIFAQILKGQQFIKLILKFPFLQYLLSGCLWFNIQYSAKQPPALQLMKQNLRLNNM